MATLRHRQAGKGRGGVMEYILCAAIWYKDLESQNFLPVNCESGVVVCGWRHSNCIAVLNALNGKRSVTGEVGDYTQGFLTNKNRFVDRKEGWAIAEKANQINDRERGSALTLYSEDLY